MLVSLLETLVWIAGWYAAAQPGQSNRPTYIGVALLAVLLVALLIKAYRVWEEIHDVEEPDSPGDLLASFEQAHAAGELDDEELERVRARLQPAPSLGEKASSSPRKSEATPPPGPDPLLDHLDESSASDPGSGGEQSRFDGPV